MAISDYGGEFYYNARRIHHALNPPGWLIPGAGLRAIVEWNKNSAPEQDKLTETQREYVTGLMGTVASKIRNMINQKDKRLRFHKTEPRACEMTKKTYECVVKEELDCLEMSAGKLPLRVRSDITAFFMVTVMRVVDHDQRPEIWHEEIRIKTELGCVPFHNPYRSPFRFV